MTVGRRRLLLAAAAGAWGGLCWLPFGLAPLLPLNFLIAMRGLRLVESPRQAVAFGVVNGIARYAVAAHFLLWLTRYSVPVGVAFYLLAIAYIVPFAILESWGAYHFERRFGLPRSVGFALIWSLMEQVRTVGDISFPADLVPHAFGTDPAWLAWNAWIGPVGFTLFCFVPALLLDLAIERRARPRAASLLATLAVAVWLLPPATDALDRTGATSGTEKPVLRVGIVQPFIEVQDKLSPEAWPRLRALLERLTVEAAAGADLVVWPETTRPGVLKWIGPGPPRDEPMLALADRVGVPILYGTEIARVEDGRVVALYNGASLVFPGGRQGDWYGKQRLLPFAEGMPFGEWLGWDPARRAGSGKDRSVLSLLGNFRRGPRPTVFEIGEARIGVLVCYEGMYHTLGRRYRLEGATALAVMTNDAWWGESAFAPWHARMIASQARSLGVPVLRAANSGVSSLTDSSGRLVASSRLSEVQTLQVTLPLTSTPPTFFSHHGTVVPWSIVGFLALVVVHRRALRLLGYVDVRWPETSVGRR